MKAFELIVDKVVGLVGMVLDKLRVNVVILALLITWIIIDFGEMLITKIPATIGPEVLALLIGTGIGGLIAAMTRMFESPQVPADVHERLMKEQWKDNID